MSRLFMIRDEATMGDKYKEMVLTGNDGKVKANVVYEGRALHRFESDYRLAKEQFYTYGDKATAELMKVYESSNKFIAKKDWKK